MPPKPLEFEGRRELRQTFADINKAQITIVAMNKKIADRDPFSPKEVRKSYEEIKRWNKFEDEKIKLLQKNDRVIQDLKKHEAEYTKTSFEAISIRQYRESRQGFSNALRGKLKGGRKQAEFLSENVPEIKKEEYYSKGKLINMVAAAAASFIKQNITSGWEATKTEKMYSLMAPGELGGQMEIYPGIKYPYGRFLPGITKKQDANLQNAYNPLGMINQIVGNNPREVWENAFQMRLAGGRGGINDWAESGTMAGALSKMGSMTMDQMVGLKSAAVKGGFNVGGNDLANIFAKATALGLTGGRPGEFAASIKNLMESAQITAGNTDPKKFTQAMWMINNTGKSYTQGSRGEQIALGLQGALLNPGGGVAGQLMSLKVGGFGAGRDYFGAMEKLQEGLTDENLGNLLNMFRQSGDERTALMALNAYTGGKVGFKAGRAILWPQGGPEAGGDIKSFRNALLASTTGGASTSTIQGTALLQGGLAGAASAIQTGTMEAFSHDLKRIAQILEGIHTMFVWAKGKLTSPGK